MIETLHFVPDRAAFDGADELVGLFGPGALDEAARRAEASRRLGNHIHFTRWRRVERTLVLLASEGGTETRH